MMDQQIKHDIDVWSDQKLRQWLLDSVYRYEMMDASTNEAMCSAATNLMVVLAHVLVVIDAPPKESGEVLELCIEQCRNARKRKDEA